MSADSEQVEIPESNPLCSEGDCQACGGLGWVTIHSTECDDQAQTTMDCICDPDRLTCEGPWIIPMAVSSDVLAVLEKAVAEPFSLPGGAFLGDYQTGTGVLLALNVQGWDVTPLPRRTVRGQA